MMTRRQTLDRLLDLMYEPDEEQMATIKALMEGLDKDLTRACEAGRKKCSRKFKSPWSPKLMNAKRTIQYWKMWETEVRNKVDMHD
jgi:hypothetical protein